MPQSVDEIFERFSNSKKVKLSEEKTNSLKIDKYLTELLNNMNKNKKKPKTRPDTNYLNSSNIIIKLFEEFKPFGYDDIKNLSLLSRRESLKNIIQSIKQKSVYRRLISLKMLVKNKDIELYNILREDAKYIKELIK
jgi:hypothetical protein